jgi:AAA ATPase domain
MCGVGDVYAMRAAADCRAAAVSLIGSRVCHDGFMTGGAVDPVGTLGGLLATRRRQRFVGRSAELDLFRAALEAGDPTFRVMFVYGPGGVGKSTLLDAFAAVAADAEACVVQVDGREVAGSPRGVLEAIGDVLEVPDGEHAILPPHGRQMVLLVDGYEWMAPIDAWVRSRLLPRLTASTLTVLAGRLPPRAEWRADPAWSDLLRVISLRNLDPDDARTYLDRRGVPAPRRSEVLAVTHGHPLTLSLVVDVLARDPQVDLTALPTDLVSGLLQRLVTGVPSPAQRRTLEVSAVARTTTEGLLRSVVGDAEDPHVLFDWLAESSITEVRADGVRPHDLVRDLLDAELRWRDPDGYRQVFRAIRAYALQLVRRCEGREQQRAIADLKFPFRNLRSVLSPVAWEVWGDHYPERAAAADRQVIVDLVRAAEGDRSAALAERWLDVQPKGFHVVRGSAGTVRGVIAVLDLTRARPEDRDADPGTAAAWRFVERTAPVRAGETVTQCRFIVDAEAYQGPSPTINTVAILSGQHQLTTPHLAWDFVTLAEPDRWNDYFAAADLPRAAGADFHVGGRLYGLFAHDFRRVPVEAMTQRWTERALADDALVLPAAAPEPELLVLAHADFDAAVRQAMRDLHRPELLARNPLARTRLVATQEGADAAKALDELLRAAVASLTEDPRDDRLVRALDRTYLRTSRTQEAAAAALGLPFSTYRRHLRQGLERVVAWLWQRELGIQ